MMNSKMLLQYFPGLTRENANRIATAIREIDEAEDYHAAVDEALEIANKALGGHGVEVLQDERAYVDYYYMDIIALYVNMGDTYATTLLYDTENEEFLITSWGDFFEAWEQEQEREMDEE